jgi:acyl-coenzyme A thioesterase PaaI-like protein
VPWEEEAAGECAREPEWGEVDRDGAVHTVFKAHEGLQGYRGILHGGVITALLDAAMANCLFLKGVEALTGDLHVRFLKPVP